MISMIHRPLGAALLAGLVAAGAHAQTAPASTDDRLKKLETQLQQQQEQNKQILDVLKQMQQGQPQTTPAAATSASPAAAAPKKDDGKFTYGWIARIMPVGSDAKVVPADELGHFVAEKDSYRLSDFSKETSIRSGVDAGWKGEAFLEVTESGRHTFSLNFIQDNPRNNYSNPATACWGNIQVEGQTVAQGVNVLGWPEPNNKVIKSIVGGADLEPGRYKVEFWSACGEENRGIVSAATNGVNLGVAMNVTFEMMVKRPSDAGPVSAGKSLVVKLQKS